MTEQFQSISQLDQFCQQTKTRGIVGGLIGKSLSDRNAILEKQWAIFNEQLEKAKSEAAQSGKVVEVDGAGISLANGGDIWGIHPDGTMKREFSLYPDFPKVLPYLEKEAELDLTRVLPREEVFEATFNALWGPSATNWQPVVVVEISESLQSEFIDCFQLKAKAHPNLPLLLLLRRDHYDSLLGDVMEAFGFQVTAKEESIDVGIYEEILKMSFCSKGLGYHSSVVGDEKMAQAVELVKKELTLKKEQLTGAKNSSDLIEAEIKKIDATLLFLAQGRYFPDALFQVGYPKEGGGEIFSEFSQLTLERTTQRVASSVGEVPKEQVKSILDHCLGALSAEDRACLEIPSFSWHDSAVIEIGAAMFDALYGKGADLETKQGGVDGFLSGMHAKNYIICLKKSNPDILPFFTLQQLENMPEADLKHLARETDMKASYLGSHLLERMTLDGKYQVQENGDMVSDSGRKMSVALMVKLLKAIATTFGNFFLKFKNSHPVTLMIIAKEGSPMQVQNAHFKAVGKVGALLTYEVRRLGYTAITKTGPIDLAKEPIRNVLIQHFSKDPSKKAMAEGLQSKEWTPAMVFQFGFPLAGSDLVDAGTEEEHTGYEERKRDRRPTRFGLDSRYIPSY